MQEDGGDENGPQLTVRNVALKTKEAAFPGWAGGETDQTRSQLSLIAQSGPCFQSRLPPPPPGLGPPEDDVRAGGGGIEQRTWAALISTGQVWGPRLLSPNHVENFLAWHVGQDLPAEF